MAVHAQPQASIEAFVQERFPNQFLIPVTGFAKIVGENYGSTRNRIAAGTFELPLVRRGSRNFVAVGDLVQYLVDLQSGQVAKPAAPVAAIETEGDTTSKRRGKYDPEAKARAAASKKKRQAQAAKARAARAALQKNEEVAA